MHQVKEKMKDPAVASGKLIKDQADFIIHTDYRDNLKILATKRPGDDNDRKPVIIYTRSDAPQADSVVDVVTSSKNLLRLRKNTVTHIVFLMLLSDTPILDSAHKSIRILCVTPSLK